MLESKRACLLFANTRIRTQFGQQFRNGRGGYTLVWGISAAVAIQAWGSARQEVCAAFSCSTRAASLLRLQQAIKWGSKEEAAILTSKILSLQSSRQKCSRWRFMKLHDISKSNLSASLLWAPHSFSPYDYYGISAICLVLIREKT